MKTNINTRITRPALAAVMLFSVAVPIFQATLVNAAALAQVEVRFDRMKTSEWTSGLVCANPTTVATEASVQVTYPAGYTVSTTAINHTVGTSGIPSGTTAWPSIATATAVSGQTVTFPSGDLTPGTVYCFNWTNNTNAIRVAATASPSLVGSITTRSSAPADIDTGSYSTAAIVNDQVTVTATVPSLFSFAVSTTSDFIGTLSYTSPTAGNTWTTVINTNAKNGWQVWARGGANTGLRSTSAAKTIPSKTPGTVSTLAVGEEAYNTGATVSQTGGSAAPTVDPAFLGNAPYKGGGLDTTLRPFASSTGTAQDATISIKNNASMSSTTPPASDYTDTITIVGAGLF